MLEKFLADMEKQGWNIEFQEKRETHLPKAIEERYTNIPQQWLDLISSVKHIINSDETTWFLCKDDFDLQEEGTLRWNEWELISLESAEGDAAWENEIKEFWDNHLPVILSVKDGYSYYAISMNNGSIVYGAEPEFEECEKIADSFEEFILKCIQETDC